MVQNGDQGAQFFCGKGTLTAVANRNKMVLSFESSPQSKGGRFMCHLRVVRSEADKTCHCGWKNPVNNHHFIYKH